VYAVDQESLKSQPNVDRTLKNVEESLQEISSRNRLWCGAIHKEYKERIDGFTRDIDSAQNTFQV
jgi:hypothetical protein